MHVPGRFCTCPVEPKQLLGNSRTDSVPNTSANSANRISDGLPNTRADALPNAGTHATNQLPYELSHACTYAAEIQ
jgi:hypothetical protein